MIEPQYGIMCDHTAIARHDVAYATYLATTYADEFDAWIDSGSSGKAPKKHNWVATYSCCTYATMPAAEAPLGNWSDAFCNPDKPVEVQRNLRSSSSSSSSSSSNSSSSGSSSSSSSSGSKSKKTKSTKKTKKPVNTENGPPCTNTAGSGLNDIECYDRAPCSDFEGTPELQNSCIAD
ncbi:hypothetical protein TeGR_g12144, partial [Tetraparma gracilis]